MKEPLLAFELCDSGIWKLAIYKSRQLWIERLPDSFYRFLELCGGEV